MRAGFTEALKRVEASEKISPGNKEILLKFLEQTPLFVKTARQIFYADVLRRFTERFITKDFLAMDKDDWKAAIIRLENSDYATLTKIGTKSALKKFVQIIEKYEWHSKEYPDKIKWLQANMVFKEIDPAALLAPADIENMIKFGRNDRDKALVSMLFESGCRISELLNLKIGDLLFDDYGVVISVTGKTGRRTVRLVSSVVYLSRWLDQHPTKLPGDFLWKSNRPSSPRLSYETLIIMLRKCAASAGISKPIHPHAFRHAKASALSKHLTEAQLSKFFGWTIGSNMPRVYVSLSNKDVDDAILELNGKKPREEINKELSSRICQKCKKENGAADSYCKQCGQPLTEDLLKEQEARRMKEESELMRLITPEIVRAMLDKLVEEKMRAMQKI